MSVGRKPHKEMAIRTMIEDGTLEEIIRGSWSEKDIYQALGISLAYWHKLKNKIPQIEELIDTSLRSHRITFYTVKASMYKRAIGYTYTESETECKYDSDGNLLYKVTRSRTKYAHPELGAQKLILGNLARAERMNDNPDSDIAEWSNNPEPMTIRTEGSFELFKQELDDDIKEVLDTLKG